MCACWPIGLPLEKQENSKNRELALNKLIDGRDGIESGVIRQFKSVIGSTCPSLWLFRCRCRNSVNCVTRYDWITRQNQECVVSDGPSHCCQIEWWILSQFSTCGLATFFFTCFSLPNLYCLPYSLKPMMKIYKDLAIEIRNAQTWCWLMSVELNVYMYKYTQVKLRYNASQFVSTVRF